MPKLHLQLGTSQIEVFEGSLVTKSSVGGLDSSVLTVLGNRSILAFARDLGASDDEFDLLAAEIEKIPNNWVSQFKDLHIETALLIDRLIQWYEKVYPDLLVHFDPWGQQFAICDNLENILCFGFETSIEVFQLCFCTSQNTAIAIAALHDLDEPVQLLWLDAQSGQNEQTGPYDLMDIETTRVMLELCGMDLLDRESCERYGLSSFCPFTPGILVGHTPIVDF